MSNGAPIPIVRVPDLYSRMSWRSLLALWEKRRRNSSICSGVSTFNKSVRVWLRIFANSTLSIAPPSFMRAFW